MRRIHALALSLVLLAGCSESPTAPRTPRALGVRPTLDAVALHDAVPVDTALAVVMTMGESVNFGEAVLARLGLELATDCRAAHPDVGRVTNGWLVAGEAGETLLVCNGARHTRLAPEDGEDSPEETWAWAPFTILLRVQPQDG